MSPLMARTALGGLLTLALLPALSPGNAAAHTRDDPSTDLIAGGRIDAGDVKVCNDDATLTVTYEATYPWCLLEIDLHVARSESDIPQNRTGNPTPDEFDHGDEHDCVGTAVFEIPLDDIDGGVGPGDTVAIAAHAEVEDGARAEGAWGKGARFVERGNWAMYFTYAVQEPSFCGGEASRCVFVTSTTHNGNLGGLAGADATCQAQAEAQGSLAAPGTYKAWLSTEAESAAARLAHATVPYKRVDGTPIAENWDDLTDESLAAPINVTETGDAPPFDQSWTGTVPSGDHRPPDCAAWTSASGEVFGQVGENSQSSLIWTAAGTARVTFPARSIVCSNRLPRRVARWVTTLQARRDPPPPAEPGLPRATAVILSSGRKSRTMAVARCGGCGARQGA